MLQMPHGDYSRLLNPQVFPDQLRALEARGTDCVRRANLRPLIQRDGLALRRHRGVALIARRPAYPFRCSQTFEMTTEPSPTDEATLFTDPDRTSPTAKIPGRDVA
jgi:hypothetical protein